MKAPLSLIAALVAALILPLEGQEGAPAPLAPGLAESFDSLEKAVLPALRSAQDRASADAAALQLELAAPHLRQISHVLVDELSPEEEQQVLPLLAPRMQPLMAQLDDCCRLSAALLSDKPAAYGSELLTRALASMLDTLMGVPPGSEEGRTAPAGIPLALAEADAQLAAASSLLASLERLQSAEAVERELPSIRAQLEELRALQRALADSSRWSKTQLFLIMQRTKVRGAEIIADLGKCTSRLMGLTPPCYGSVELEKLLTGLLNNQQPAE